MRLLKYLSSILLVGLITYSCSPQKSNETTEEKQSNDITSKTSNPEDWKDEFDDGFHFIGIGENHEWTIKVIFDKNVTFNHPKKNITVSHPFPDEFHNGENMVIVKHISEDSTGYKLVIKKGECHLTDEKNMPFKHHVEVDVRREEGVETFMGCGLFINDIKLNDIWALVEMNGEKLKTENFPDGMPRLEFNISDSRVNGNGGCNEIMGPMDAEGDRITFGMLVATRKACPNMDFEQKFLTALTKKTLKYVIGDGLLTLVGDDGSKLTFKKVD
ncbi:META domain-containing protein [Sediminitomix flava]|uniref:Heat shock protein HslJ n=1 Tax=Sediminitomix flava TaxID=379075 RepID=A0A315Z710_SEDFL|nr:META domain-containing protein [Sediminitomix flava]PWJ40197.1 heat shock protein HslJ [Sediminitomix flava]